MPASSRCRELQRSMFDVHTNAGEQLLADLQYLSVELYPLSTSVLMSTLYNMAVNRLVMSR